MIWKMSVFPSFDQKESTFKLSVQSYLVFETDYYRLREDTTVYK
jgi:hypothetical protein